MDLYRWKLGVSFLRKASCFSFFFGADGCWAAAGDEENEDEDDELLLSSLSLAVDGRDLGSFR